jgi:phosphoglycerol transferase
MTRAVVADPRAHDSWRLRIQRRVFRLDVGLGAVVAIGTVVATVPLLRLWRADLHVPFVYEGDGLLIQALVKEVIHGWYFTNPALGAPFGQELYDYPFVNANTVAILILKAIGLFSSSAPLVLNLYFLLTFALCALTAFVVFRKLGVSRPSAAVCSILFSLLPAHFQRGEAHLFLSSYFGVPLGAYLALAVLAGRPLFALGTGQHRFLWSSAAATAALCVVVGTTSLYYAVFTVVLVASAGVVASLVRRDARALLPAAGVCAAIGAVLLVQLGPTIAYRHRHGTDPYVAQRGPAETEQLSLKIADLVLPADEHRLAPLERLKENYTTQTPLHAEFGQSLGTVGTVGFVALLLAVLVGAARPARPPSSRLMVDAGLLTVVALLFGTIGGIATLISYTISPGLHAWNRIAIFIAFFSLLAVALLLDSMRASGRSRLRRALLPLTAAILVVGALDQTSDAFVPSYRALTAENASDAAFVHGIERRLPAGAEVFQLPYLSFPEAPSVTTPEGRPSPPMMDYDHFRGYLHSSDLRWSYGAIRGRPADWAFDLVETPPQLIATAVAATGFDGIYVDRFGYPDSAASLERALRRVLHERPLVSPDQRLSFFELARFGARTRATLRSDELQSLRAATLAPIRGSWSGGFWGEEGSGPDTWHWSKRRSASIELTNPSPYARTVEFSASLATDDPAGSYVLVTYPDGSTDSVNAAGTPLPISRTFRLRPGRSSIRFFTSAPNAAPPTDPRGTLYLRVLNARGTDVSFPALAGKLLYRPLLALRIF